MQTETQSVSAFERAISYFERANNSYDNNYGAKEALRRVKDTRHMNSVAELLLSIGYPQDTLGYGQHGHVRNSTELRFAADTITMAARREHDIGQYVSVMSSFPPGDFDSFRTMLEVVELPPVQRSYVMESLPKHARFLGGEAYHRWPFYVKEKPEEGRKVFGYREHPLFQPLLTAVSEINFWGMQRLWNPKTERMETLVPDTSVVVDFFEHFSEKPYAKAILSLFSGHDYKADAVKSLMAEEVESLLDKISQKKGPAGSVASSLFGIAKLGMDIKPIAVSLESIANSPFIASAAGEAYQEAISKGTTEATLKAFQSPIVLGALQEYDSHVGRWGYLRGDLVAYLGYAARLGYSRQSINEMAFRLAAVSGIAPNFRAYQLTGPEAVHKLAESVLPRWGKTQPHENLERLAIKLHAQALEAEASVLPRWRRFLAKAPKIFQKTRKSFAL